MNKKDAALFKVLANELAEINKNKIPLPGINNSNSRDVFIKQIVDSVRRVDYIYRIRSRGISSNRCDPLNSSFDPIRAAILKYRRNNIDEAIWLIFLSTHFGKHLQHGWLLMRDLYSGLDNNNIWTWERICANTPDFVNWFNGNYGRLRGAFGNHRKYESIRPGTNRNLIVVISSYIDWVGPNISHASLIEDVEEQCDSDPYKMFSYLYGSLTKVVSFGRTARFDFLTMLGKTDILNVIPASPYLRGATGPLTGAKLLLSGRKTASTKVSKLEEMLGVINDELSIGRMGMQVLEDSLCNWQKNPMAYGRFRG